MIAYEADTAGKTLLLIMRTLNEGIYSLISTLCQLFMNISETRLFSDDTIAVFLRRIYVIIGILMLFKLAFSLLNAIINPDMLTDKEKGLNKIIPRTVLVLMMLIFSPLVFEKAMAWQQDIALVVPKLIIGKSIGTSDLVDSNQGELLASTALKAFIQQNKACDLPDGSALGLEDANTIDSALYETTNRCSSGSKQYLYQFNGFVSLIVGLFLVVLLASYCIDIAMRTIKLGLLRILAPIPIISYIEPKNAKSGGSFSSWINECVSTYIELFIKLAILYFSLFILSGIVGSGNSAFVYPEGTSGSMEAFIKLFLILGTFFFMGKAAEFICKILGVKKPDNKGGWLKGLAGIGAALGIGAATVSGGFTNYRGALASQKARGITPNRLMALGNSLLGAGSGLITGSMAVAGAQKGKMGAAIAASYKRNARYATAAAGGATLFGKVGAAVSRAATGETSYESMQRQYDAYKEDYEDFQKDSTAKKALYDHLVGEGVKKKSGTDLLLGGSSAKFGNTTFTQSFSYDQFKNAWEVAKQHGQATFSVGGQELMTYGQDTTFADAKMKDQLGNIYYGATFDSTAPLTPDRQKDMDKVQLLAKEADVALPSNATGFTKSVKDRADDAADKATNLSTQMRDLKKQMEIPKANTEYINKGK